MQVTIDLPDKSVAGNTIIVPGYGRLIVDGLAPHEETYLHKLKEATIRRNADAQEAFDKDSGTTLKNRLCDIADSDTRVIEQEYLCACQHILKEKIRVHS